MTALREPTVFDRLKLRVVGMRREDCTFDALGYQPCEDAALQRHLEGILQVGVDGFALALRQPDLQRVVDELERIDPHHRGFAFEGVGAYLAGIDLGTMGLSRRLERLVRGPAAHHDGLALLGAGFAAARVPWGRWLWRTYRERLDPQLAWCMADGLGFHQGLFRHRRFVHRCDEPPDFLPRYDRGAFDSGVGRSLWWVEGASPRAIAERIHRFPTERQAELWNGVGTACTYAAGVGEEALSELDRLAGEWREDFLSGVCFAPLIRRRGRNPSGHTERSCRHLLGMSADQAADLAERVLAEAEDELSQRERRSRELYDTLRRRMRVHLKAWSPPRPAALPGAR